MGKNSKAMIPPPNWDDYLTKVGAAQDKVAFSALFAHFSPLLKSFLMSGSNISAEGAEELVQETMIKIWRKAPSFAANRASASTWIYTIARNTRIDWLRKSNQQEAKAMLAEEFYGDNEAASPYATLVQIRNHNDIHQHLSELPQEQSEVLNMMYFKGLSGQQAADALALPLGTVKSRVRLALAKLRISPLAGDQDAK